MLAIEIDAMPITAAPGPVADHASLQLQALTLLPITSSQASASSSFAQKEWSFSVSSDSIRASDLAVAITSIAKSCGAGTSLANYVIETDANDQQREVIVRFSIPVAKPELLLQGRKYWMSGTCEKHGVGRCGCNSLSLCRFRETLGQDKVLLTSSDGSEIMFVRTPSAQAGALKFASGQLNITAPTGDTGANIDKFYPELIDQRRIRLTDLVWAVDFDPQLTPHIANCVPHLVEKINLLATASQGALDPFEWGSVHYPKEVNSYDWGNAFISYSPFWPNHQVAESVADILCGRHGRKLSMKAIPYGQYLANEFPDIALSLIIQVPAWPGLEAVLADLGYQPVVAELLARVASGGSVSQEEVLEAGLKAGRLLLGRFRSLWYQSNAAQMEVDELGLASWVDQPQPILVRNYSRKVSCC